MLSFLVVVALAPLASALNYGPVLQQLDSLKALSLTNQILNTYVDPLEVQVARNSYVVREGTSLKLNGAPWTASGANVYWLGLDENVIPPAGEPFYAPFNASYPTLGRITEVMNILQTMGARTIRSQTLGVSVGNPLSVMPTLGQVNEQAFNTIDWAVFQARQHGIRIVAPLIDNYDYYHGGKFDFLRFRGINISSTASPIDPLVLQFYTNRTIINDFKSYIHTMLTHLNPYTGLTYAADPTIYAYETGNELGGPIFGDQYVPVSWTTEIASYIKQLGPHKLVQDGTYGINETHFKISEIDIFSDHFYPLNNTKLISDIAKVATAHRTYIAGEYDWTGRITPPSASTLSSFFNIIESHQKTSNPVIVGDQFWSLFGHDIGPTIMDGADGCNTFVNHSDTYTLHYNDPNNTALNNTQISTIRQHLFKMQGVDVGTYLPQYTCPGPEAEYTYL